MYDIPLRALKDTLTAPVANFIPAFISPNHLTLASFISGLFCCYAAAFSTAIPYSLILWLLNRLFDCLDGCVARQRKIATETGGFLDLLSDFVIYSLLPISVAFGQDKPNSQLCPEFDETQSGNVDWLAIAVLEATFHVNNFILFYIAAVASKKESKELTSVTLRPALVEGFESGVLFTAMLLWPGWIAGLAWGMSMAVMVGIMQRIGELLPILARLDRGEVKKEK